MKVSAEAPGPTSARELLAAGADEVLIPCIGDLGEAVRKAARVAGPVTVHVPVNRIDDPRSTLELLRAHGLGSALVVSGNPGHGRGTHTLYELIPQFREQGMHVSVGAYPEDYFTTTSAAHRSKSAAILVDKQAAGAQRVITQASFSVSNLRQWLATVRSRGVGVPIHVGVMAPVPRATLGGILRTARAEIFTHPRVQASRENLDLLWRMLRSHLPDPERFVRAVADLDEMGSDDGFHIFSCGADVSRLIATARATGQWQGGTGDGDPTL